MLNLQQLIDQRMPEKPITNKISTEEQRLQYNSTVEEQKRELLGKLNNLAYVEKIIANQIANKVQDDYETKLGKQKKPTNPRLNPEADLVGTIDHGHNNTTRTNEVLTDYVFGEQDDKNPLQSWTFQEALKLQFQGESSYGQGYFQDQDEKANFQFNIVDGKVEAKLLPPFTAADQYFYQQYLDEEVNLLLGLQLITPTSELTYSDIINNIRDAHRELYNKDILATTDFDKIFKNRPRDERMLGNLIKHAQEKTTSGGRNRTFKAMQHAGYLNNVGHCISSHPKFNACWKKVTEPQASSSVKVIPNNSDSEIESDAFDALLEQVPKYSSFVQQILNIVKKQILDFTGKDGVQYKYNERDWDYYAKYLQRLEADLNKVEQHVAERIANLIRSNYSNCASAAILHEQKNPLL